MTVRSAQVGVRIQADKREPPSIKGIAMHRLIVCVLIMLFAATAHADAAFQFTQNADGFSERDG